MTAIHNGSLRPMRTSTLAVDVAQVTLDDHDRSTPFLLLHGGGGVATVAGFADLLAERTHSRVLVPTHPGFGGTPRPAHLSSTRELAAIYVELLDQLDLHNVTVIGNSFGGWLAAEIALLKSPRVSGAVIVDGVGVQLDSHPMTDVRGMAPADLRKLSFHDPSKAPVPSGGGTGPSPDIAALIAYAGPGMSDSGLAGRLAQIDVPVHVIWGGSDGIVGVEYGRRYADAIPGASFTVLPETGHLPQVETPEELLGVILEFLR